MQQLPRNGTAFPVGTLGRGGPWHGAGPHSPLQISARILVGTVFGRFACSPGCAGVAKRELAHDRPGPAAFLEETRTRVQPGGTTCRPFEPGRSHSFEQSGLETGRTNEDPNTAFPQPACRERP